MRGVRRLHASSVRGAHSKAPTARPFRYSLNWKRKRAWPRRAVMSLPPTLDQVGWEVPASSAARLVGVAGPRMKLARRFAAEGAMRTNVVIVSTPSLAFSPSFVEAQEPVGVQAL
jgi:hypothetical protein